MDTDNNGADFAAATPNPHNSVVGDAAPSVSSSSPIAGATGVARDANVVVTFSEPVNTVGNWFIISCSSSDAHVGSVSGGPTTYTLDPTTNFAPSETCTVSISAANVTDVDGDDPPDSMAANHAFTLPDRRPGVVRRRRRRRSAAIQGSGATAAITGNVSREGVVVGDFEGPTRRASGLLPPGSDRRRRRRDVGRHLRLHRQQRTTRQRRRRRARDRLRPRAVQPDRRSTARTATPRPVDEHRRLRHRQRRRRPT